MKYSSTIGLEIHVELKTKTKMFCDSLNDPSETHPNINICPVCVGHPGTLPVINKEAIKKVILAGKALNCRIADETFFERKNYFYPDLPKGYQISQYQAPLCIDGYLEIPIFSNPEGQKSQNPKSKIQNPKIKKIRIKRIHLEEDTGKLFHSADGKNSFVDFNRAGVPLMELVIEPDLENGQEVRELAQELQLIFRYLNISDADMEKGQLRIEVNISLAPQTVADKNADSDGNSQRKSVSSPRESASLGIKVEIKNLNSIRAATNAVDYEIKRQSELLKEGKKIIQETRGWDDNKKITYAQRTKEESQDYRYFPEPDLPPLNIKENPELSELPLPELPAQRRKRFKKEYGLKDQQVEIFTSFKNLGDYYEKVASELDEWASIEHRGKTEAEIEKEPHLRAKLHTLAANYMITELPPLFNAQGPEINELEGIKIMPEGFAQLMVKLFHKEISSTAGKEILKTMAETGLTPEEIIREKDLAQVSDTTELNLAIEKVIAKNPKPFEDLAKGKKEVLKFLVGQVMRETKGKANPQIAAELIELKAKLN